MLKSMRKSFKPKIKGRPFQVVLILKGYFSWKLGSPHWNLMAEFLQPYCKSQLTCKKGTYGEKYSPLQNWWQHMKKNHLDKRQIRVNEVAYAKWVYDQYLKSKNKSYVKQELCEIWLGGLTKI